MLEHELSPVASKFISSLVKSLQLLCNGHVDYTESIELIGHINVRVDHVHKYDYIVDEHVSKEGSNSSTFLSNSYHCNPPSRSMPSLVPQEESQPSLKQNSNSHGHTAVKVSHKVPTDSRKQDNIMVKMEGNDDDCMVLPASPEDYEQVDIVPQETGPLPGTSSATPESYEIEYDVHHHRLPNQTGKKRKVEDLNMEECSSESKVYSRNQYQNYSCEQQEGVPTHFECYQCGQYFYNADALYFHESSSVCYQKKPSAPHRGAFANTHSDSSCNICGEVLNNEQERLKHMNAKHNWVIYPCQFCEEVFGGSRLLLQHKRLKHESCFPQLNCTMCEKSFTTQHNLRGHMNMHLGLKPYLCNFCGDSFAYSQSRNRHHKFCKTRNALSMMQP